MCWLQIQEEEELASWGGMWDSGKEGLRASVFKVANDSISEARRAEQKGKRGRGNFDVAVESAVACIQERHYTGM